MQSKKFQTKYSNKLGINVYENDKESLPETEEELRSAYAT